MLLIKSEQMKKVLARTTFLWLLALIVVLWIDKPLALFIHANNWDQWLWLRYITEGLPTVVTLVIIALIIYNYWTKWRLISVGVALYFYLTLRVSMEIKTGLKIIFGRYWPKTWIHNNLSLIHDGAFGFNWGHGFLNQGSFPSGHSTYIAFCCVWLLLIVPSLRIMWYFLFFIMPLCLIVLDYHFLGDCLAGLGLGYSCAFLSIFCLERYWPKITEK